jgi:hypothetical protein
MGMDLRAAYRRFDVAFQSLGGVTRFLLLFFAILAGSGAVRLVSGTGLTALVLRLVVASVTVAVVLVCLTGIASRFSAAK